MPRFAPTSLITVILVVSCPLNAAEFFGLGDLPGGEFNSNVRGISADGSVVVGRSDTGGGRSTAFRWTREEGMLSLGLLEPNYGSSFALGVSGDGQVVVGVGNVRAGRKAFIWSAESGMTNIGNRRDPLSATLELARAVSFDGSVVTGFRTSEDGKEAFVWTEADGIVPLGQFSGEDPDSVGRDVSADGSTILVSGDSWRSGAEYNTFLWRKGEANEVLPNPGGDVRAVIGQALSSDGSTVVGKMEKLVFLEDEQRLGVYSLPFRWTSDTGVVELDQLHPWINSPNAVSGDGSVVVGQSWANGPIAVMWDDLHGVRSIRRAFASEFRSPLLRDWQLLSAFAVSDNGQIIVGHGINPDGNDEAWMVVVPEPSSVILAMFGLIGVLRFVAIRRRATGAG